MNKWIKKVLMVTLVIGLITGCSSGDTSGGEGDKTILKLGHVWPKSEIHAQAAEKFAAEVEELTDGEVKVEIYGDGTLGDDKDLLEGLKVGSADIWVGGAGVLSGSSDTAKIFTVPFMFEDQEHFENVYNGEVGQEISDKINEESGYKVVSYWTRGPRWLTVDKEVNTPEDLKGMKIRVPDSPVFVNSWKKLGASPTPMDFGEVFTSLQQGVINGQENPLSLIYNSKFNEVVDYLVKTEHVREPIAVVVSDQKFQSLSKEHQEALLEAANGQGKEFANDEVLSGEEEYLQKLQDEGMTLIEPDIKAFQSKLDGFVEEQFPEIQEVYEKIRESK
ncbi:TRAP transporter substrate-binding protein [Bacillus sp. Marseille-Q3570]|uniref:TRAP transporter substrate-binding protein n=1 Tax=Bacillus sp. Marseille-Q3570 TaxID=2963522 RepID=UPI0021B795F7|nr:TRAP transporter substrate-binding protein [Bacillus sp. Marseille-Q3570]